ncbi:hypothetical protein PBY51_023546 [Eleginops maclovinus]|uniref:Uncharacterized protein n=1 Tax=Eleginops maclovinus TaxID=56733 RepID=A0AAN8AEF3_ELEMC|nr:hypothetical protein PBY51_023546 [Eleginops maclovinus]
MLVLNLVFLALLASSTAQSGIPKYIQRQWTFADDGPQYEDSYEPYLVEKVSAWPQNQLEVVEMGTMEDFLVPITPEPYTMKEEGSEGEEDSAVWKIVLVVTVLLASVVGSLSISYYMCFWRGGRIHYRPQKGNHA